jgi:hypothetical protein
MQTKLLEIRDKGTFIPALAIQVDGGDGYLLRRAGFGSHPLVILVHLEGMKCAYDPYDWGNRTMNEAHNYIQNSWESLKDGDVVDVQFVIGETAFPKLSESQTVGG